MTPKSGRAIAWLSFLLGISVSIAGNIGHAASDGLKPGEWAGAAFWPLALMLSIEILTRVRWQPERRWTVARLAGLVLVALVAMALSYRHLAGLMTYWGEDTLNAYLGPLAVDGLMLIAATALLSISKERPTEHGKAAMFLELVDETAQVFDAKSADTPRAEPESQEMEVDARAEAEYFAQLDFRDDADSPDPQPEPLIESKLHIVNAVSEDDAESAARQAWITAPPDSKPSVRKIATIGGWAVSTAHRRIDRWKEES